MSKWLSWCHCDSDEATVTLLMPQEMFYAWPQASGFMVWLGRLTAMVFNERTPVWNKWPSDMSLYCVFLYPSSIRRRAYRLIVFILCRAGSDQTRQGWMDIKGLLTYFTSLFLLENMHPNIYYIFLLPFLNIGLDEFAISCRSGNRKSGAITLSTWLPPQVLLTFFVGTSSWIW